MSLPPFLQSSLPLSLGHSCGDLSEWLCWLIDQRSPYIWGLSAGLQSARAAPLSSLTTQVALFGLNELWRAPAMPASHHDVMHKHTNTHKHTGIDTEPPQHMRAYIHRQTHTHTWDVSAHAGTFTYSTPWLWLPRTPAFPHDLSHSINRQ